MRQQEHLDFDTFYDHTYAATLVRARVLCRDHHLAEDLAAEAYLEAFRRWDRIHGYDDLEGWMYRAIRQRFLKQWYRRARLRARLAAQRPATSVPAPDEPDITMRAVLTAVHDLPDRQREVVIRRHLENQSVAEIATALDITAATVGVHLHRARQRLAREFGRGVVGLSRADELVAGGEVLPLTDEQALAAMLGAVGEAMRAVYERDWAARDRVRDRVDELIAQEGLR